MLTISFFKMIQRFGKGRSSHVTRRPHAMLAGISQTLFLKNWGEPDAEISLRRLGKLREGGTLYLSVNSGEKADCSIWIYRKKDRVLFFAEKKLHSHFKWSGFEDEGNRLKNEMNMKAMNNSPCLTVRSLALVA
jgi:hypothetical protein